MWKIVAIAIAIICACGGAAQLFSAGWLSFGIGAGLGVVAVIVIYFFGMSCWEA